jgi:hypothetical protein
VIPFFPILFFAVIVLLILAAVGLSFYSEKKRREQMEATAQQMGLNYLPDGDANLLGQLQDFGLFNTGRSRKMKNLIQGDSGEVKIAIFDYQYTTGSGKNSTTHKMTIAALQSSELNCPHFTMRPQSIFDRFGSMLGFQDIDFDTHPLFSKSFVLQGTDEETVRHYFKPALLTFFENQSGISVEAQPGMMFFYRPGKRIKPDETKDLLGSAYEVFGAMVDA